MRVLVFAPHADDEVLGCGGTIARYVDEGADVYVCVVTNGLPPVYDNSEAVKNNWPHILYPEIEDSKKVLGYGNVLFLQFPAVMLETVARHELNSKIQATVDKVRPDIVFIPHFGDMQKDHMLTAESVMVAVRPKSEHIVRMVYSYETLSETEWNNPHVRNVFMPNVFVDISRYLEKKTEALSCYKSQLASFPNPRSIEAVESLARYRGATSGSKGAEAFVLVREYRM